MEQAIIDSLPSEMRARIEKIFGKDFAYNDLPAYYRQEKEAEFEQMRTESKLNDLKEEQLKSED